MNQICVNARENGMLDDPRITFDTEPDHCDCYQYKFGTDDTIEATLPKVCGNCVHYSVQE